MSYKSAEHLAIVLALSLIGVWAYMVHPVLFVLIVLVCLILRLK